MKFAHLLDQSTYTLIEVEQRLNEAHREGWEQAKREAVKLANTLDKWGDWESDLTDSDLIANAIAAMEYGGSKCHITLENG